MSAPELDTISEDAAEPCEPRPSVVEWLDAGCMNADSDDKSDMLGEPFNGHYIIGPSVKAITGDYFLDPQITITGFGTVCLGFCNFGRIFGV
jgi:hypothetical protein